MASAPPQGAVAGCNAPRRRPNSSPPHGAQRRKTLITHDFRLTATAAALICLALAAMMQDHAIGALFPLSEPNAV